jgi:hypothetical protein
MLSVLAIDPGSERSAWVYLRDGVPKNFGMDENRHVRTEICAGVSATDDVVIEMIASYGMAVGAEVFETCVWIGRFMEALTHSSVPPSSIARIKRMEVKSHLCHRGNAKDANIRQALIDRFGPGKEKAIGTKAAPGPLYGMKADLWAALAVGVTYWDQHKPGNRT